MVTYLMIFSIKSNHGGPFFNAPMHLPAVSVRFDKRPIGHIHAHTPLRNKNDAMITPINMARPAGWIGSHCTERMKTLRPTKALMGRNASTACGLWTNA